MSFDCDWLCTILVPSVFRCFPGSFRCDHPRLAGCHWQLAALAGNNTRRLPWGEGIAMQVGTATMHFLFNVFKSLLSCDAFFRPCPIQWVLTLKINELNIWVLDFPKAHYEHIHAYTICRFNLIPCLKKIWLEGCWRIQQVLLVLHKFAHHHHHQSNHPAQMFLWKLWM